MKFKKIFLFILTINVMLTPVLSFADDYAEDENLVLDLGLEVSSDINEIPNINARHAVVIDRLSKNILFGKAENEKCKMASTTKILTCIVVLENCTNLNDVVKVSKKAARNRWF